MYFRYSVEREEERTGHAYECGVCLEDTHADCVAFDLMALAEIES